MCTTRGCASSCFPPSHSPALAHAIPSLGLLAPLFLVKKTMTLEPDCLGLNLDLKQIAKLLSALVSLSKNGADSPHLIGLLWDLNEFLKKYLKTMQAFNKYYQNITHVTDSMRSNSSLSSTMQPPLISPAQEHFLFLCSTTYSYSEYILASIILLLFSCFPHWDYELLKIMDLICLLWSQ